MSDSSPKRIDLEAQRAFYNERWRSSASINRAKLTRAIAILEAVLATKLRDPEIVELGCGSGWFTGMLSNLGPATGVDLADEAIREAVRRYPQCRFVAADVHSWQHPHASFDLVISHEVLEHVEDQRAYIDLADDLLRDGGFLVLTTPSRRSWEARPKAFLEAYEPQPIERLLYPRDLKTLVSTRFEVVDARTILPGLGTKGTYRFATSPRLRGAFRRLRMGWIFDEVALRLGYGVTSLIVGRKRSESRESR